MYKYTHNICNCVRFLYNICIKSWICIIYVYYTGITYIYTYNSHIKKTCFPDAILFLDIKYNITWLNRTEPEPEMRFDEPKPNLTRSLVWFGSILAYTKTI